MVIVLLVMGPVVATVLAIVAGGLLLPARHESARQRVVRATPEAVWSLVADPAGYPAWRRGVTSVDLLGRAPLRWREFGQEGAFAFEVTRLEPPHVFSAMAIDDDVMRRPLRTLTLEARADGTLVTLTEQAELRNPITRFVCRYLLRPEPAMAQCLRDLQRALEG